MTLFIYLVQRAATRLLSRKQKLAVLPTTIPTDVDLYLHRHVAASVKALKPPTDTDDPLLASRHCQNLCAMSILHMST